jgi:hypothetical protein
MAKKNNLFFAIIAILILFAIFYFRNQSSSFTNLENYLQINNTTSNRLVVYNYQDRSKTIIEPNQQNNTKIPFNNLSSFMLFFNSTGGAGADAGTWPGAIFFNTQTSFEFNGVTLVKLNDQNYPGNVYANFATIDGKLHSFNITEGTGTNGKIYPIIENPVIIERPCDDQIESAVSTAKQEILNNPAIFNAQSCANPIESAVKTAVNNVYLNPETFNKYSCATPIAAAKQEILNNPGTFNAQSCASPISAAVSTAKTTFLNDPANFNASTCGNYIKANNLGPSQLNMYNINNKYTKSNIILTITGKDIPTQTQTFNIGSKITIIPIINFIPITITTNINNKKLLIPAIIYSQKLPNKTITISANGDITLS